MAIHTIGGYLLKVASIAGLIGSLDRWLGLITIPVQFSPSENGGHGNIYDLFAHIQKGIVPTSYP